MLGKQCVVNNDLCRVVNNDFYTTILLQQCNNDLLQRYLISVPTISKFITTTFDFCTNDFQTTILYNDFYTTIP